MAEITIRVTIITEVPIRATSKMEQDDKPK